MLTKDDSNPEKSKANGKEIKGKDAKVTKGTRPKVHSPYEKDLIEDLKEKLTGNTQSLVCCLFYPRSELDAMNLHKAIAGAGTDVTTFIVTPSRALIMSSICFLP